MRGVTFAAGAMAATSATALLLASAPAAADESVPIDDGAEFPYRAARHREAWFRSGVVGDWYLHPSFELAFDFELRAGESFRAGVGVAGLFARYGDRSHGVAAVQPEAGARYSAYRDEFVDVYGVAKIGVPITAPLRVDLRPGIGAGVRVLRAVSLEATFEPLVALGAELDGRARALGGYGLLVGFDVCSLGGCSVPRVVPEDVDTTCDLYTHAVAACVAEPPARRAELCAAVDDALDPVKHPPDVDDPTATFLDAVVGAGHGEIATLAETHRDLKARYDASVRRGKELAAGDPPRALRVRVHYAPYAGDVRQLLGCDAQRPGCAPYARCTAPLHRGGGVSARRGS